MPTMSHPDSEGTERRGPLVIGLVGGVGSGKSEVARLVGERGGVLIDADRIGHELLQEPAVKQRVAELWGSGVFDAEGEVDRAELAAAVFSGSGEGSPGIQALNEVVHPKLTARVRDAVDRARRQGAASWVVVDAALLLEWGLGAWCDVVVFVEASEQERRGRVAQARGWSAEELNRRERCQFSLAEKRTRAQRVLQNTGSREALIAEVEKLLVALGGPVRTGRAGA